MNAPEACEACGAEIPAPRHGCGIGGGWLYLCDPCAARVCACGACVLEAGESGPLEFGDVDGRHTFDRCEVLTESPAGGCVVASFTLRPPGCPCDACAAVGAFGPEPVARDMARHPARGVQS